MPNSWIYYRDRNQYQDADTGKFISQSRVRALMQRFENNFKGETRRISDRLSQGEISIQRWVTEMRQAVKDAYVVQYTVGKGGLGNMAQADWGRIGGLLKGQYAYLNQFAAQVAGGGLTPKQIAARAALYVDSSTQAFERGKAASHGITGLPAYPGDGSTECMANCRCYWDIKRDGTTYTATWKLSSAEHCQTCTDRAASWVDLVYEGVNNAVAGGQI